MKKRESTLFLFILPFFSTSFIVPIVNDKALAAYEVRHTFTGYIPSNGGVKNCNVNEKGKVILSGILKKGNENTG